jgi:hypothetical protein
LDKSLNLKTTDRPQSIESLRRFLPNSSKFSCNVEGAGKKYNNQSSSSRSESFALKSKAVVVSLGIALLFIVGAASFRGHPAKQDDSDSGPKVSPILIEKAEDIGNFPSMSSKNVNSSPALSQEFHKSLSYLSSVSASSKISSQSIPNFERAINSFNYVVREVDRQFDSLISRGIFSFREDEEFLIKNFSLGGINALEFRASAEAPCTPYQTAPTYGYCIKSGPDFKCRFSVLPAQYKFVCVSAFVSQ